MIPNSQEFLEQQRLLAEEEQRIHEAGIILHSLGLDWKDLTNGKAILDVGAKHCLLQRTAREKGFNGVVSLDREFPERVIGEGLNIIKGDASEVNLPEASKDLILVRSSAYYYTKTELETFKLFENLHKALKRGGKQLVFPARFGHIIEDLKLKHREYRGVKEKDYKQLGPADKMALDFYNNLADKLSLDFLKERNIFARKLDVIIPNAPESFKYYLEIPKF
jgi:hypothetical protein